MRRRLAYCASVGFAITMLSVACAVVATVWLCAIVAALASVVAP